ncbi:uncharacterized protein EI90DRAFT_3063432, partial [Cantharellus anzutake]
MIHTYLLLSTFIPTSFLSLLCHPALTNTYRSSLAGGRSRPPSLRTSSIHDGPLKTRLRTCQQTDRSKALRRWSGENLFI